MGIIATNNSNNLYAKIQLIILGLFYLTNPFLLSGEYIFHSKMDASKHLWREKRIEVAKALILKDSHP
jgi:hypothetical protein